MSVELETDLPPDAIALAERVRDRDAPVLFWSASARAAYVACDPIAHSVALDPEPELGFCHLEHGEIPRWFGLIPYEARRGLERSFARDRRPPPSLLEPSWRRYGAVAEISSKVNIIGDSSDVVHELFSKLRRTPPPSLGVTAR